ncbi:hypothetical protein BTE77_35330, partial [Ensifer adhaerens]
RGSHHGLAATAVHSREAGYIYATGIVICDVATPCTDGLRIPVKSAADSETKPATYSDFIPATIPI